MEPDISSDEITHLEQLIVTLRRRQRVLETQRAKFDGAALPSHIVLELEDLTRDLAQHTADLRRLRPRAIAEQNPYLGLLTFQETDADRFFGRDALIADLIDRAGRATFLAVLGASGSGKSSVVRAGLVPMLKGGALPGSERWRYVTLRPGARPLDALAVELAKLQGGNLGAVLALSQQLASSDRALLVAAGLLLDRAASQRLVLVVDQAEELWTLAPTAPEAQAAFVAEQQRPFIQLLLTAIGAPDAPLLVVLTMRADFLHRAAEQPTFAHAIAEHDVIISPMSAAELHDAILRPAELAGGTFEPGLLDELVEQTLGRAGALPLLEYTLQELWKRRADDGAMAWESYRALGGIEGALAARADAILAERYTPAQQNELRRLLLRLVQPGEGAADTRRRAALDDLVPAGSSADAMQALLQPLTDERLLVVTGTNEQHLATEPTVGSAASSFLLLRPSSFVELSHEALIRAWPTFGRWIAEARADLRFQLQLEDAAKEWQASDASADLLWSGLRLAQAEAWITRTQPRLNARDQTFLDAGRAQANAHAAAEEAARQRERQQAQRLRWLAISLAGALVVALLALGGAGIFANRATQSAADAAGQRDLANTAQAQAQTQAAAAQSQRNLAQTAEAQSQAQLRVAQAQSLAYAAESLRTTSPETALLLASEALRRDDNFVTAQTMRNALNTASWRPKVLNGHTDHITSAVFSPDGQRVLTASDDNTVRVWNLSGQQLATLQGHTGGVTSAVFSPDGQRILTTSNDHTARIWNLSGQQLATLQGHTDHVTSAVFSPDGQRILTASWDQTARIWNLSGQQLATLQGHTHGVTSAVFSPDGQRILTASDDQTVQVWDVRGKRLAVLQAQGRSFTSALFSPDGQRILAVSNSATVSIWDLSGKQLTTLDGQQGPAYSAVLSPDAQHILTRSIDRVVRVLDLNGKQLATLQGHTAYVTSTVISPDGQRILTGSDDGTARLWDVSGKLLAVLQGHTASVTSAVFSPDGQRILTASNDNTARLWDLSDKQAATLEGHTGPVYSAVFSPDGQRILTASDDSTARLWDVNGKQLVILQGHTGPVYSAVFSPDGQRILTASDDSTARLWDVNGKQLATLQGHTDLITSVVFSPDSQRLLTASWDGSARLWDLNGEQLVIFQVNSYFIRTAVFSPDGQRILTASDDGTARLWDVSGKQLATLQGHTEVINRAVFSSDGQRILTASWDGSARLWGLNGEQLATFQHNDRVTSAVFSPDGQDVLTASDDKTARLWDLNGKELATLQGHTASLMSAVFSPDGRHILTGSQDGTARQYLVRSEDLLAVAACRVGRGLTDEEIQRYQVPTPLTFDFSKRQCPPPIGN